MEFNACGCCADGIHMFLRSVGELDCSHNPYTNEDPIFLPTSGRFFFVRDSRAGGAEAERRLHGGSFN